MSAAPATTSETTPSKPKVSVDILGGLILGLAAIAGVLFENIDALKPLYDQLLTAVFTISLEGAAISKPLLLWINDGLMAVFFLFVALEIKKEVYGGALSDWKRAALPVAGAAGGMIAPALIFVGIVGIDSAEARGWAIPAATDIAFALGVLSLFGNRIAPSLKIFLLALAIVDDLAAIIIIAVFYTANLSLLALGLAAAGLAGLAILNLSGVRSYAAYILLGIFLWVCVLKSGVHATLAGVALGFAIPMAKDAVGFSPMITMKNGLRPWVAFLVMPVFAFANAGVPLGDLSLADLGAPLTLAIMAGLFIGKQIGVFGFAWAAIKTGIAQPPVGGTMVQMYGVSLLAGIGFTMSLFIGTLAFADVEHQNAVRLGVIAGSLLSGVLGAIVLIFSTSRQSADEAAATAPSQTASAAKPSVA
ncbi:MAG: Na+/H+ antiporter NhaA [Pseudomonadota bacterium]